MNILFIGNSYTYFNEMPRLFEHLAAGNGKAVRVRSITKGARKLSHYAQNDPTTEALDALLAEEAFDICFIQEQSLLPATDFEAFQSGLDCVIRKLQGKADSLILYATWGRKSGSGKLAELHWTTESMTGLLSDAYEKAARLYGAQVSAVGERFLYITQNHPEINLYHEDLSHPSYAGSCLAALTHYYTVFREFPAQTEALCLSTAQLSAFRSAVCR